MINAEGATAPGAQDECPIIIGPGNRENARMRAVQSSPTSGFSLIVSPAFGVAPTVTWRCYAPVGAPGKQTKIQDHR